MKKRLLSMFLTLTLCLSFFPSSVLAGMHEQSDEAAKTEETTPETSENTAPLEENTGGLPPQLPENSSPSLLPEDAVDGTPSQPPTDTPTDEVSPQPSEDHVTEEIQPPEDPADIVPPEDALDETIPQDVPDSPDAERLLDTDMLRAGGSEQSVGTIRDFMTALNNPDVTKITLTASIRREQPSYDSPLVIPKHTNGLIIDGAGNELSNPTGGIVLGGDTTFQNIQINFPGAVRNGIFANGHSLTLENVEKSGSYSLHLFCGGVIGYTAVDSVSLPSGGTHGQIILKGSNTVGSIFAGNFADKPGNDNTWANPSTILIEQTGGSISGDIYACGGFENRGTGDGDHVAGDFRQYPTTGNVTIEFKSASGRNPKTAKVYGAAASNNAAKAIVDVNGNVGTFSPVLENIGELDVKSGELQLSNNSNFANIGSQHITIAKDAILDLANLDPTISLNDLTGGGSLVLGQKQTITFRGQVRGTTEIAIGNFNFQKPPVKKHTYIVAANSAKDAFTLKPNNNYPNNILARDDSGAWTVQDKNDIPLNKENTPNATFTATDSDKGILSDVTDGMQYQIGTGSWIDIGASDIQNGALTLSGGLSGGTTIKLVKKGNGTTTSDSDPQIITLTQANAPTGLTGVPCTNDQNTNGNITGMDESMEYRLASAQTWTAYTANQANNFAAGTYHVRTKAQGEVLASMHTEVIVDAKKASIPASVMDAITGYTGVYDGVPHNAVALGSAVTSDYTVQYSESQTGSFSATCPQVTNVSDSGKNIWVKVSHASYGEQTKMVTATISAKQIDTPSVTVDPIDSQDFTGNAILPKPIVKDGSVILKETSDYTYTCTDNVFAGTNTAKISMQGAGNYTGTKTVTFSITPVPQTPSITATASLKKDGNTLDLGTLVKDAKGKASFAINGDGRGCVITGNNLKSGSSMGTIKITVTIEAADVGGSQEPEYQAFRQTDAITVEIVDKTIDTTTMTVHQPDIMFGETVSPTVSGKPSGAGTVTYKYTGVPPTSHADENAVPTAVGTYKVTATCNTADTIYTAEHTFQIQKKSIQGAVIQLNEAVPFTYNGNPQTVTVKTITVDGTPLAVNTDYTIQSGNSGTDADTYTLVIEGTGNYTDTATFNWVIAPLPLQLASATAVDRPYAKENKEVEISSITFQPAQSLQINTDYTAKGLMATADAGDAKEVSVTVALTNKNYTLAADTLTTTVNITKAAKLILPDKMVSHKAGTTGAQTLSLTDLMPTDAGVSKYTIGVITNTSSLLASDPAPSITDNILSYTLNVGKDGDRAVIPLTITSANYEDSMVNVIVMLTDKEPQSDFQFADTTVSKFYNDTDFTFAATGAMGNPPTYSSSQPNVATVNDAGEVTITGVGSTIITATSTENENYMTATASYTLQVNKATITITANDKSILVGDTLPSLTSTSDYTITGLRANETLSRAPTLTYEPSVPDTNTEGTANIKASGAAAPVGKEDCYEIHYANGTLTISKKSPDRPSGGGSSSGSGSSSTSETTKNPDGSTTTTVTDKKTGTVTTTTKEKDGSVTIVEKKKDGTVTTKFKDKTGNQTETVEKPDGSSTTKIQNKDGSGSTTTIDQDGKTNVVVKVPSAIVENAVQSGNHLLLPMPTITVSNNTSAHMDITLAAQKNVIVSVPVDAAAAGTVAVLVRSDGTREIIKKSVLDENGLSVPLNGSAVIEIVDNGKSFTDTVQHWAKDAVSFVTARELFTGTSHDTFTPDSNITRGMLVKVLHNLENNPKDLSATAFSDVQPEDWYADSIQWAVQKGIVLGYGDGSFGPDEQISREQLAAILYRYAGTPTTGSQSAAFVDAQHISAFAQNAMNWALEHKLLTGKGNGILDPQGPATRAEVATVLMRYITMHNQ